MSYRGHMKGGVIVLDEAADLPENAEVRVEPVTKPTEVEQNGEPPKSLADQFRHIIGIAPDMPPDMAENHDHYLYGTPK